MRRAVAIAGIAIMVTGCASTSSAESAEPPTRTMIPRPLVEREIGEVLLSPEEIAASMGVPAMTVIEAQTALSDHSDIMAQIE